MRNRKALLLAGGAALVLAAAGCGDDDFANDRRPATAVNLDAVIRDDGVAVSPTKEGAGQVEITFSNQTDRAHTITLEGEDVIERTAPIQPQDTATIIKTLRPGVYEVRAGSNRAVDIEDQIRPATLTIGPERADSNNDLLLP
jgi:flagellar basal body rod protein FlgF